MSCRCTVSAFRAGDSVSRKPKATSEPDTSHFLFIATPSAFQAFSSAACFSRQYRCVIFKILIIHKVLIYSLRTTGLRVNVKHRGFVPLARVCVFRSRQPLLHYVCASLCGTDILSVRGSRTTGGQDVRPTGDKFPHYIIRGRQDAGDSPDLKLGRFAEVLASRVERGIFPPVIPVSPHPFMFRAGKTQLPGRRRNSAMLRDPNHLRDLVCHGPVCGWHSE